MKFKPLSNRIVVQRSTPKEKTESGIIIPSQAIGESKVALVCAVGPGVRTDKGLRVPVSVEVGDLVLLDNYVGTDLELSGEKYLIIRETDIIGIVEDS